MKFKINRHQREVLKWSISIALAISIILIITITAFQDNKIYKKGYEANNAYERVNETEIWKITANTQNYFSGTDKLRYFDEDEQKHLEEVKNKIILGKIIIAVLVILSAIGISYLEKKEYDEIAIKTSYAIGGLSIILLTTGLFWEWFFITFHKILFTGQWMFEKTSLMIQLWGGNFFETVTKNLILRIIITGIIIYIIARITKNKKIKQS